MVHVLWTNNEVAVERWLRLFSCKGQGPVSKDAAGFQSCWSQWKSLSMSLSQPGVIFLLVFLQMGLLWIQSSCNVSYQSNFPSRMGKFCKSEFFFQMKMWSMWWYLWAVIHLCLQKAKAGKLRTIWVSHFRDPLPASSQLYSNASFAHIAI